jgi:tetratricopeptide (TPR) repeat protein
VAVQPDYLDAWLNLAATLQRRGETDAALACCEAGLAALPDHPALLLRLGHIAHAGGNLDAAAAWYGRAIAAAPDCLPALCNLGTVHLLAGRHGAAMACYRQALATDPALEVANVNMAGLLAGEGRLAEARGFAARVPRPQPLVVDRAAAPLRTVLVLASSNPGNVPLQHLLSPATNTIVRWNVDYATDDQEAGLPPADVVFNGIGNADIAEASAERIGRLHACRPVLNPPDAVARTRRDRLAALLADIPDVVAPQVVLLRRDDIAGGALPARLQAAGLMPPLLLRPIVGHGGAGLVRVDGTAALAALPAGDADAFYAIAYRECRDADGYWRKYRMIFVDRQPYPYHLAISRHWLVHYFSADMLAAPWKRAEEQRFLVDPAAVLGERAMLALSTIARRLDLDFAGIDFALLPDGRIFVFEANATMLVHMQDPAEHFAYRHPHVRTIFAAFEAMLARAARVCGRSSTNTMLRRSADAAHA